MVKFISAIVKKRNLQKTLQRHRVPGYFKGVHLTRLPKILRDYDGVLSGSEGVSVRDTLFLTMYSTICAHPAYFDTLDDVFIRWSEKSERSSVDDIYIEHGWLPRTSYQISREGCNGRSRIKFNPSTDYVAVLGGKEKLLNIKGNICKSYGPAQCVDKSMDKPFILVALQKGDDFNLKFSGSAFSKYYGQENSDEKVAQAVVDYCQGKFHGSRLVFSLHPSASVKAQTLRIDPSNQVVSGSSGMRSIDFIRSENCLGVVAINSNVLHEALVFNKPIIPLGQLLWNDNPFVTVDDADSFKFWTPYHNDIADNYLAMLLCNQWYLDDFRNPFILMEIVKNIDNVTAVCVRREYGVQVF